MPSEKILEPAVFTPQTVFLNNGKVVIMGALKKGELVLETTTSVAGKTCQLTDIEVLNKHVKSVKAEDQGANMIGITLSNISIEEAQALANQELIFR